MRLRFTLAAAIVSVSLGAGGSVVPAAATPPDAATTPKHANVVRISRCFMRSPFRWPL